MKSKRVDMLNGSVAKGLLLLAVPIMIMNVVQSLVSVIDMAALRLLANDHAVGAVGACGALISLCTCMLIGMSTGANVVVAKSIGQHDKERLNRAILTAIPLSIVGGAILTIIGVLGAETFLKMMNCPESLFEMSTSYFKIYFLGVPLIMFYNFCASILRAMGDTKKPMYFLMLGGAIKIIFTILFIVLFNVTVEGVAFATIVSYIVISILAFKAILQHKELVSFDYKKMRFYKSELKEIVYIGIPTGLQTALTSFANVTITSTVNSFGADATTGIAIANQFDTILYQICYAPSLAAIPYVAQNVGARNIKRVKKTVLTAAIIATLFGTVFGSLLAIFSGQVSSLLTTSPAVIKYAQQRLIIVSSLYFLAGIQEILGGALRGCGKPILPTISTLIFMCLIRFPWVYFVFPLYPNLTFLYLIWPIGWILSIITLLIAYFRIIYKLEQENNERLLSAI